MTNNAPEITSSGTANFYENQNASSLVALTITATDEDDDDLTFSISGGADAAKFAIDETSGDLSFKTAPAAHDPTDADTDNVYEVTIRATDTASAFDEQAISVTVIANSLPAFSSDDVFLIDSGGTEAGTVVAADDELDTLVYSISGGADALIFNINSSTGVLTFATAADYDNPTDADSDNNYQVTVQAADSRGAINTQDITVTVLEQNPPVILTGDSPEVVEGTTFVIQVLAEDPDFDSMTFSITGGDDAAFFTMNSSTGDVSFLSAPVFAEMLDADENGVYEVTIAVSDGRVNGTTTQDLHVIVLPDE